MLLSDYTSQECSVCGYIEFQSLFYWMLLSDIFPGSLGDPGIPGFNPCFIGCCYQTNGTQIQTIDTDGFQSLFYWMLLSDQKLCAERDDMPVFQSLFYWM